MSFSQQLEHLPIFLDTTRHSSKDLLVVRNEVDIFFLNRNILRCSTISSNETSFHLLGDRPVDFDATALVLNVSGSLAAVVGPTAVETFLLPELLVGHEKDVIRTTRHHIKPLGRIWQAVWHPALENDALVLLVTPENTTSTEIWVYDLAISVSTPTIKLEAPKNTTSIVFGSNDTLLGMLSLYSASKSGQIHCFYPLLYDAAKIRANSTQISDFYQESKLIMLHVNEICSPSAATESNPLKNSASYHHEVVSSIYHQITKVIKPRIESGFYIFDPIVTKGTTKVQGPVYDFGHTNCGVNLAQFFLNPTTSTLVAMNDKKIVFLAQYAPLLMKFDDVDTIPIPKMKPVSTYKAPVRGFGYLEDSESEETGLDLSVYKKELGLWRSEFSNLTLVGSFEDLRVLQTTTLTSFKSSVIASGPSLSMWIDTSPWRLQILELRPIESGSVDKILVFGHENSNEINLVVTDVIRDGVYLVTRKKQGAGVSLRVLIPEILSESTTDYEEESKKNGMSEKSIKNNRIVSTPKADYKSILTQKPISELQIMVDSLNRTKYTARKSTSSQKIDPTNLETLSVLNNESSKVVKSVAEFTRFYIELHARVQAQIVELNSQISKMTSMRGQTELNSDLADRITAASEKQKTLTSRLDSLQKSLYAALETQYIRRDLPMSKEEKAWFKELNEMVLQINVKDISDKKLNDNLGANLASLSKELEELKLASPKNKNLNEQKFTKMVLSLLKKEIVILNLRKNLDEQMKVLDAKIA